MPNAVDAKIDEVTQAHVAESEAANISRNVEETAKRVKDAIAEFSAVDVLASGYWEGLYYEAKIMALRNAVLEIAKSLEVIDLIAEAPKKPKTVMLTNGVDTVVVPVNEGGTGEVVEVPAPKKARKPKAAA